MPMGTYIDMCIWYPGIWWASEANQEVPSVNTFGSTSELADVHGVGEDRVTDTASLSQLLKYGPLSTVGSPFILW